MKKTIRQLLPAFFLAVLPCAAHAQGTIDGTTILQFRQDTGNGVDKKTVIPATQFLGADFDKLWDGNLSLHLYGWGRQDLANKSASDDKSADGNLTYGYLQYRLKYANAQAKAGRFFVNEGILSEQVDGLGASTDLPYGFGLSAFGGATVHTDHVIGESTDGKGDAVFGGRLRYRYKGLLEVGVAGVYETKAPTLQNPGLAGTFGDHRLIGGDIYLTPYRMVQVMGHTSYNTETRKVAEHSYAVTVEPLKKLTVSGSFDQHNERDYFYSSVIFSGMVTSLAEQSRSFGGSASYELTPQLEISADVKEYQRDFADAQRFGGELRGNFLKNTLRTGASYHYLNAGQDFALLPALPGSSASFHEARAYALHDTKGYFSSLDVIGYFFKRRVENRKTAWETVGSLGYHLTPSLALSGDLSYGQNAWFNDEVRGVLRLTFNTTVGKGEPK